MPKLRRCAPVRYSKRLVGYNIADWPPNVDDTHTTLQQALRIFTKMAVNTRDAGVECLVNVNAFLRAAMFQPVRISYERGSLPQGRGSVGLGQAN